MKGYWENNAKQRVEMEAEAVARWLRAETAEMADGERAIVWRDWSEKRMLDFYYRRLIYAWECNLRIANGVKEDALASLRRSFYEGDICDAACWCDVPELLALATPPQHDTPEGKE